MVRQTKLIFALTICMAVLATLCLTGQAQSANKISTSGEIRLYQTDGKTYLTEMTFPLFTPGQAETLARKFYIKNTGNRPVQISWRIADSSIAWTPKATHQASGYIHTEGDSVKFSLRVRHAQKSHASYITPEQHGLTLNPHGTEEICFELTYSGTPNTAETFTFTVTFTATAQQKPATPNRSASFAIFNPQTLNQNWLTTLLKR